MKVIQIVVCPECRLHWPADQVAPACERIDHRHRPMQVHRHLDVVVLPDGTEVMAASFDPDQPYARVRPPDLGLYLDDRWRPPWPHRRLDWPDFGVPDDPSAVANALGSLLASARAGQLVELGCLGGHGRTGTALAGLAILTGLPADQAVGWVRSAYCHQAVETPEQEAFVEGFSSSAAGRAVEGSD